MNQPKNNSKKIKMCQLYIAQKLKQQRESEQKGVHVKLLKYDMQNPMKNDYQFNINKEEILNMMSEEERNQVKGVEDLLIQVAEYVMNQAINGFQEIENSILEDVKEGHKKYGLAS